MVVAHSDFRIILAMVIAHQGQTVMIVLCYNDFNLIRLSDTYELKLKRILVTTYVHEVSPTFRLVNIIFHHIFTSKFNFSKSNNYILIFNYCGLI